ncbi:TetR family transcriptional regulator C-terminal domain-containing protein [Pseudogemmobacter faecipullorum]|uniref:TetR family transcriptional regulator C-terminal domain-containing protein n=1 Tax=Pseudogemmobacter faecipullorum TaxID=2755041 RepID=A0ABS8CQG5_9RHOB|nr:TetR family transcriptional regulator C-terminal domain-containing protein [Pseudogemmobacter faecipullorum]MCB5411080.1 TetR family transcriptional regulator C-terminal domain-containing protein [Pseudogemmobacter faecipullorum]
MSASDPLAASPRDRRPYIRDSEENRREALIQATQELVAEGGPRAATVRAIAERAGVTPGLIRHYFGSKQELSHAAYTALMDGMTEQGAEALDEAGASAEARLAAFISASLRPPVVDPRRVGLWAGFLHQVQADPGLLAQHEASYLHYRDRLQQLIAALGREVSADQLRREAIACNAMIDGLWLEGSVIAGHFAPGELENIGLSALGTLLGVDLLAAQSAAR